MKIGLSVSITKQETPLYLPAGGLESKSRPQGLLHWLRLFEGSIRLSKQIPWKESRIKQQLPPMSFEFTIQHYTVQSTERLLHKPGMANVNPQEGHII
jgi:hypothetical protein